MAVPLSILALSPTILAIGVLWAKTDEREEWPVKNSS
jgi:hypothetical protein